MTWQSRLANALWVAGFRTVDIAGVPEPHLVTVDQLSEHVRRNYTAGRVGAWDELGQHLRGLRVVGGTGLAVRAFPGIVHMVILRPALHRPLDVQQATDYFHAVESWIRAFERRLPDLRLSDEDRELARSISSQVLGNVASNEVAAIAADIVIRLAEAGRKGWCLTLHLVGSGMSEGFKQAWSEADLTSIPTTGLMNVNATWAVPENSILPSGRSSWESHRENLLGDMDFPRITALLQATAS